LVSLKSSSLVEIVKTIMIESMENFKSEYAIVIVSEIKNDLFEFYMSSSASSSSAD
jgi:hypothetical protein